jgi:hypothetical protein
MEPRSIANSAKDGVKSVPIQPSQSKTTVRPCGTAPAPRSAPGGDQSALRQVFRDAALAGDVDEFCAIPAKADQRTLDARPRSAGHTSCYISPDGEVFPWVQFPVPTGNVGQQPFREIWRHSEPMNEVRSTRVRDVTTYTHVSSCSRCSGPAYREGNLRAPSSQDCQKSFAGTGIPAANLLAQKRPASNPVQIRKLPAWAGATA